MAVQFMQGTHRLKSVDARRIQEVVEPDTFGVRLPWPIGTLIRSTSTHSKLNSDSLQVT